MVHRSRGALPRTDAGQRALLVDGIPQFGISDKGKSFVENDQMCFEFEKLYEGIKSCSDYYNNPEGTHNNKSQFIGLNDIMISFFSIQE